MPHVFAPGNRIKPSFYPAGTTSPKEGLDLTGEVLALSLSDLRLVAAHIRSDDPQSGRRLQLLLQMVQNVYNIKGFVYSEPLRQMVLDFFGVKSSEAITQEMHDAAKEQFKDMLPVDFVMDVKVMLTIRLQAGQNPHDVINDMGYDFTSNTQGAVIRDTEIVESGFR